MTHFLRVFRRSIILDNKFKNYLVYAIGEVFLIVIGILLALQINIMREKAIKRDDERTVYKTIKDQINNYEYILRNDLDFNRKYLLQFEHAIHIIENKDRAQTDTLGKITRNLLNNSDFDGIGNIYETVVNSGEIKLLKNSEIVEELRRLEEQFLWINRIEKIHYEAVFTYVMPSIKGCVNFSTGEVRNLEKLYDFEFLNLVHTLVRIMNEKEDAYVSTITNIEKIKSLIDQELNKY